MHRILAISRRTRDPDVIELCNFAITLLQTGEAIRTLAREA
jgi:hypothetical protein